MAQQVKPEMVDVSVLPKAVTVMVWGEHHVVELDVIQDYLRLNYVTRFRWRDRSSGADLRLAYNIHSYEAQDQSALIGKLKELLYEQMYPRIKKVCALQAQPTWMQ